MGISTLQSYQGAQIFEILGLNKEVVDKYFTGAVSRIEGVNLDGIATEALAKAKELNASNPRIYILEAQDKFYTPEQFGGSKAEAKVLFEKAKGLFDTYKTESTIAPNWGRSQVWYFLSQL